MELIDAIFLPGSLWFIMFSIGLSLTVGDFKRVFTDRRALYVGVPSMLIVPPVIGVAMALLFAPSPELAVGFVLLATCPGGMLSNLMTDFVKGDLALSLSLTIVISMIYILVIPFYAHFAVLYFLDVDQSINVPLLDFVWKVFSITLIPATLGLLVRTYKEPIALRLKGPIKLIATGVLVIAFGFILVDQVAVLKAHLSDLVLITLAMNVLALSVAFMLSRKFGVNMAQTKAICIEHMIRQEGTAIYIAVTIIGSREMSLPMIMNTPIALMLCIMFVLAFRGRETGEGGKVSGSSVQG